MLQIIVNAQVPEGSPNGYKFSHIYVKLQTAAREAQAQAWLDTYREMQDVCEILYHNDMPVMHLKPGPATMSNGVYAFAARNLIFSTVIACRNVNAGWGLANILDDNFAQEERVAYHLDTAISTTYIKYDFVMRFGGGPGLMLNPEKYPVYTMDNVGEVLTKLFEMPNKAALRDVPGADLDEAELSGVGFDDVDNLS